MEGELLPADVQGRGAKYPLTISRTAKSHSSSLPSSSKCGSDHVTSKDPSPSAPTNRSRFYFESDTLALKNNPE